MARAALPSLQGNRSVQAGIGAKVLVPLQLGFVMAILFCAPKSEAIS
jgi:hypothetical protein